MSFSLDYFVSAPSVELLNLNKNDLLDVADHYALTYFKTRN